jgi:hypothetical protein
MKSKVGKEPKGGSKKSKELGKESLLASMFQKQQTVHDLQKGRETYNGILEKWKQLGLEEAVHTEPVRRSENDTHHIVVSVTDDATVHTSFFFLPLNILLGTVHHSFLWFIFSRIKKGESRK